VGDDGAGRFGVVVFNCVYHGMVGFVGVDVDDIIIVIDTDLPGLFGISQA